ncbi:hypothetical protein D3C83_302570 [compost metagenome]
MGHVAAVVAPEAAVGCDVPEVVGIDAEGHLHRRKHVVLVGVLDDADRPVEVAGAGRRRM